MHILKIPLFGCRKKHCRTISDVCAKYHVTYKNIYEDGELEEHATCKNYLQVQQEGKRQVQREIKIYLDYAEDQAKQHIPMHMSDWEEKLNVFLQFTGRKVLKRMQARSLK